MPDRYGTVPNRLRAYSRRSASHARTSLGNSRQLERLFQSLSLPDELRRSALNYTRQATRIHRQVSDSLYSLAQAATTFADQLDATIGRIRSAQYRLRPFLESAHSLVRDVRTVVEVVPADQVHHWMTVLPGQVTDGNTPLQVKYQRYRGTIIDPARVSLAQKAAALVRLIPPPDDPQWLVVSDRLSRHGITPPR